MDQAPPLIAHVILRLAVGGMENGVVNLINRTPPDCYRHAVICMADADVSTVRTDKATGKPYRNGNVMYEVGLALACRNPEEVLILRDDQDQLLFDLSTIPHMRVDFTDHAAAKTEIHDAIVDRLTERKVLNDARIEIAASSVTDSELNIIKGLGHHPSGTVWSIGHSLPGVAAIERLFDKKLIKAVASFDGKRAAYEWTPLGSVVAQRIKSIPDFASEDSNEEPDPIPE